MGLAREKVIATIVRLLETTSIRIGNEDYARDNGSYGLTTMRGRHIDVAGSTLRFEFRGKSKKSHVVEVQDQRVARIVRRLTDLPGQMLFQYLDDDGARHGVESGDVNAYLHAVAGDGFTAKDFRTWAGTVLAACALSGLDHAPAGSAKQSIAQAIKDVAARLGNTPAVCRRCYVHPTILDAFEQGALERELAAEAPPLTGLSSAEKRVLRLLAP